MTPAEFHTLLRDTVLIELAIDYGCEGPRLIVRLVDAELNRNWKHDVIIEESVDLPT